ncbi:toprim domain-containing protein [Blastomonas sp.]|uniref:DUF7146 domain-containing protein n=1 Tax=Blastomonas sp. TaxID=1909299 RepID=UPI002636CC03|nr:toprim domain-containing protein [Blastomonas sp.]MDM7957532.1 toprim domain-containing protein [Blastomonas sp.]
MSRNYSMAAEISQKLAGSALAVCRHYLPAGRREGRYWIVGNVAGEPGRSLYVRLYQTDSGSIGNWVDAATGEHGDLLDLIRLNQRCAGLGEAIEEARRFLLLPPSNPLPQWSRVSSHKPSTGLSVAARRMFEAARPVPGSLGTRYLALRGITRLHGLSALRFHPRCHYRLSDDDAPDTARTFPALIASVTDLDGLQTGIHRTWLDPGGRCKAQVTSPRRALGNILGHAIRFGDSDGVLVAGEGLETMLSLREALPGMPVAAATSSSHLAAIAFPPGLVRLYVARDADAAGDAAFERLTLRAQAAAIELIGLTPRLGDFNDDLLDAGRVHLARQLLAQTHPDDRLRFERGE